MQGKSKGGRRGKADALLLDLAALGGGSDDENCADLGALLPVTKGGGKKGSTKTGNLDDIRGVVSKQVRASARATPSRPGGDD